MCGIAGIVRFDGQPVSQELLQRMNHLQHHRGPDGDGIHIDGTVALGHRRLAIIDPKGGHQPLVDAERGIALTFNGEIYNYRELRAELQGAPFFSDSDTEVLLRAYEAWGIGCLDKLRGMFAFALHDRRRNRLFLVRDRLGIKPLYYALDRQRVVFASELRAVMAAGDVDRAIDSGALASYLHYQYVPTPRSIYGAVRKLEPGTYLEIDSASGATRHTTYWSLAGAEPTGIDLRRSEDRLDSLLNEITRLYVRSDVPFGAFLSGGIDSSIVTAYMARHLNEPVKTYTIGYAEKEASETDWARRASIALGTDHHEEIVDPGMAMAAIPVLARHYGEPFGDSSAVPTYFVSRSAATQVKMVLSGDGGDELFAGYGSYPALYRQFGFDRSRLHQRWLRNRGRIERLLGIGGARLEEAHDSWRWIYTRQQVESMMAAPITFHPTARPKLTFPAPDPFLPLQYQDLRTYMLDDILTKVDRASMASSLEVRVPLLDHPLVEFAFSLPLAARIQNTPEHGIVGKHLLKSLAGRIFPADFVHRRKMGFGIPVHQWLMGPMRTFVLDILGEINSPFYDHLDRSAVTALVGDYYAGRNAWPAQIWLLLMLKLWFDEVHTTQ